MDIIIDHREAQLIELFTQQTAILQERNIQWRTEALEIGDVRIHNEEKTVDYIFERKSLADLSSSIKDGRYREQKARLLATYPSTHITYIIEELSTQQIWSSSAVTTMMGISKIAYGSFIIHSMYRDGIHVYIAKNTEETALFLMEVAVRMVKHPELFQSTTTDTEATYTDVCQIKTKKQENITLEACCILQFGQIPGISRKLSKSIMEHTQCNNMREWINRLDSYTTYDEKVKYITSIPLIGKKKAETILKYSGFGQ